MRGSIRDQPIKFRIRKYWSLNIVDGFKRETIIIEKPVHLFQQDPLPVFPDLFRCQDQDIPQVLVEAFQQFVFKIREGRFKEEIFFLVGLPVMGDDDERAAFLNPVLVKLLVIFRNGRIDKRSVAFEIIFIDNRTRPSFQEMEIMAIACIGFFWSQADVPAESGIGGCCEGVVSIRFPVGICVRQYSLRTGS